jgi:hypothetical protein
MNLMKKILDMDIEIKIDSLLSRNARKIRFFFILFAINVFIYGQKLFFYSLAPDDFGRLDNNGGELASWLGRWMGGIINMHVFQGAMFIQPYFNGVLGVFFLTLAGFLTADILKRTRNFEIAMVTLLISATPMIANNLYFNANISVWLSTPVGIIGFLLFQKTNNLAKGFGVLLLASAIGCYQTIIQVVISISMILILMGISESKNLKELKDVCFKFIFSMSFIGLSFGLSSFINTLYTKIYNLKVTERLGTALEVTSFSGYMERIASMFHSNFGLMNFENPLLFLYRSMALLSLAGLISMIWRGAQTKQIKIILTLVCSLIMLYVPLVINLPNITGNGIPIRAHYTIGWFVAGFFVIQILTFRNLFKALSFLMAFSIIILSASYINIYFEAASRQTSSDIMRVNQIVSAIRNHSSYTSEPIKLAVVGTKNFSVTGWNYNHQALMSDWSKLPAFKHFTDLNFEPMDEAEYIEVEHSIIQKNEEVDSYPGKKSIQIEGDKVVVFLNADHVNNSIAFNKIEKKKTKCEIFF